MPIHDVLEARQITYGTFSVQAAITREIKRVMHATPYWEEISADKQEALDMIAVKMGRILNGDNSYKDSWVDIAGYATLVADALTER